MVFVGLFLYIGVSAYFLYSYWRRDAKRGFKWFGNQLKQQKLKRESDIFQEGYEAGISAQNPPTDPTTPPNVGNDS